MRTTLTLDDDVADFLKEQSRLLNVSFKQIVNETIRNGMSSKGSNRKTSKFKIVPNKSGFVSGIDPMKLNQLVDELEVEDFVKESHS
jgi:transcriptional/translational regulatory protein YebC/TACO1